MRVTNGRAPDRVCLAVETFRSIVVPLVVVQHRPVVDAVCQSCIVFPRAPVERERLLQVRPGLAVQTQAAVRGAHQGTDGGLDFRLVRQPRTEVPVEVVEQLADGVVPALDFVRIRGREHVVDEREHRLGALLLGLRFRGAGFGALALPGLGRFRCARGLGLPRRVGRGQLLRLCLPVRLAHARVGEAAAQEQRGHDHHTRDRAHAVSHEVLPQPVPGARGHRADRFVGQEPADVLREAVGGFVAAAAVLLQRLHHDPVEIASDDSSEHARCRVAPLRDRIELPHRGEARARLGRIDLADGAQHFVVALLHE